MVPFGCHIEMVVFVLACSNAAWRSAPNDTATVKFCVLAEIQFYHSWSYFMTWLRRRHKSHDQTPIINQNWKRMKRVRLARTKIKPRSRSILKYNRIVGFYFTFATFQSFLRPLGSTMLIAFFSLNNTFVRFDSSGIMMIRFPIIWISVPIEPRCFYIHFEKINNLF